MLHSINRIKTRGLLLALAALLGGVAGAGAAVVISVDMDPGTIGIQPVRLASAGDTFMVDLVMTVGLEGVSSYSVSANFDTVELTLDGSPAASYPALPGGLTPVAPPPLEDNALGRVWSFNAVTFGTGPSLTTFVFGSIKYKVVTPITDLSEDVTPGFFNLPGSIDSMFDNSGASVTPTFVGGSVNGVPEPGSAALLLAGLGALSLVRRNRAGS